MLTLSNSARRLLAVCSTSLILFLVILSLSGATVIPLSEGYSASTSIGLLAPPASNPAFAASSSNTYNVALNFNPSKISVDPGSTSVSTLLLANKGTRPFMITGCISKYSDGGGNSWTLRPCRLGSANGVRIFPGHKMQITWAVSIASNVHRNGILAVELEGKVATISRVSQVAYLGVDLSGGTTKTTITTTDPSTTTQTVTQTVTSVSTLTLTSTTTESSTSTIANTTVTETQTQTATTTVANTTVTVTQQDFTLTGSQYGLIVNATLQVTDQTSDQGVWTMTIENVGNAPIVSLGANTIIGTGLFSMSFSVTSASPLAPGQNMTSTMSVSGLASGQQYKVAIVVGYPSGSSLIVVEPVVALP